MHTLTDKHVSSVHTYLVHRQWHADPVLLYQHGAVCLSVSQSCLSLSPVCLSVFLSVLSVCVSAFLSVLSVCLSLSPVCLSCLSFLPLLSGLHRVRHRANYLTLDCSDLFSTALSVDPTLSSFLLPMLVLHLSQVQAALLMCDTGFHRFAIFICSASPPPFFLLSFNQSSHSLGQHSTVIPASFALSSIPLTLSPPTA